MQTWIADSARLIEDYEESHVLDNLEACYQEVREELNDNKRRLKARAGIMKWSYVALFLVGTVVAIVAQWKQARNPT